MTTTARLAAPFAALMLFVCMTDTTAQPPKKDPPKKAVDKAPAATDHFEIYEDKGGSFRFRLKHGDDILAIASKGYDTKADCRKVVEQIQKSAAKAKIMDAPKDDAKP
jgi:uncharacterized protein YegP (UPF0339 family)